MISEIALERAGDQLSVHEITDFDDNNLSLQLRDIMPRL